MKANIDVEGIRHSLVLDDIDHDGIIALIGSLFLNDKVFLCRDIQGFQYGDISYISVAKMPSALAIKDFNGDGTVDISVVCEVPNIVSFLTQDALGHFSTAADFVANGRPGSIIANDFNGDGIPDIAIANWYSDDVTTLLGKQKVEWKEEQFSLSNRTL